MASKKVRIVKVPLPPEIKNKNIPQNFPNMPISYLELIENKNKIKPDFINKEYVPRQNLNKESKVSVSEEEEDIKTKLPEIPQVQLNQLLPLSCISRCLKTASIDASNAAASIEKHCT